MENTFSVDQSFRIIKETINQARMRFERSGKIFIFWGLVIAAISFGYYFLRRAGVQRAYLINWGYLVAAILTFVYFIFKAKNSEKGRNFLARMLGWVWLILNVNIFVVAFGFSQMGQVISFIIVILVSVGYFLTGVVFQSGIAIVGALLMNIGAYFMLIYKSVDQRVIIIGTLALVCIFLPGLLMELKRQRQ